MATESERAGWRPFRKMRSLRRYCRDNAMECDEVRLLGRPFPCGVCGGCQHVRESFEFGWRYVSG